MTLLGPLEAGMIAESSSSSSLSPEEWKFLVANFKETLVAGAAAVEELLSGADVDLVGRVAIDVFVFFASSPPLSSPSSSSSSSSSKSKKFFSF